MTTMTKRCLGAFLSLAMVLGLLPLRVDTLYADPVVKATVENTTIISELGGTPLGNSQIVNVTLTGASFALDGAGGTVLKVGEDVTSWFKTKGGKTIEDLGIRAIVDSLSASELKVHFEATDSSLNRPSKRYKGVVRILIPKSVLDGVTEDLSVEENPNAFFHFGPDFFELEDFSVRATYGEKIATSSKFLTMRLLGDLKFKSDLNLTGINYTAWFKGLPNGLKMDLGEIQNNTIAKFYPSGIPQEVGVYTVRAELPASVVEGNNAGLDLLTPIEDKENCRIEVVPKLKLSGAGIKGMKGEALSANEVILTVEGDTFKAGTYDNWLKGHEGLGFGGQKIEISGDGKKAKISLEGTPNDLKPEADLSVSVPASAFQTLSRFSSLSNVEKQGGASIHITPYAPTLTGVELSPAIVEIEKADKSKADLKIAELKAIGSAQTGIVFDLEGEEDDNQVFRIDGNQLKLVPNQTLEERTYTVNIKVLERGKHMNTITVKKRFQVKYKTKKKQDPPSNGGQTPESSGSSSVVTPIEDGAKQPENQEKKSENNKKQEKKDKIKEEKKPEADKKQDANTEPEKDTGAEAKSESKDFAEHWAKSEIEYAVEKGYMNGVSSDKFSPDASVSRGMLVTVLGRFVKVDQSKYGQSRFNDVKASTYYAPYVAWAQETGIVKGLTEDSFAPDAPLTREQLAVILAGAMKAAGIEIAETAEEKDFADQSEISAWALESVKLMQKAGILNGKDAGRFDPKGKASRAELAKIIYLLGNK